MSADDPAAADAPPQPAPVEIGAAVVVPARLRPVAGRVFARVATLSKVDDLSDPVLEALNSWYQEEWRVVHAARFGIAPSVADSLKRFFATRTALSLTAENVEAFLRTLGLLYYGLRSDTAAPGDVSKNKFFQRYYYTARENAAALNSAVVMTNFVWACHRYMRDEFANTCLLDILLQAFPAALESFVKFGGVTYLKAALDYLAASGRLRGSTNYLLKALALLNKLDISFRILQTSRIGIPINGIATGGRNVKMGIDYECENDNVKLKATDLIKKWKAIRDASQPMRVEPDPRRPVRKPAPQSAPQGQSPSARAQPPVPGAARRPGVAPVRQPAAPAGSFVLNILDSMVEQREKERKRKLAMKEAQRNGLFKMARTHDPEGTPRQEDAAATPVAQDSPQAAAAETGSPAASAGGSSDQAAESRKELQSLMNFFKSFKPQVGASHGSGDPPQGESPRASGGALPGVLASVAGGGDRTGLSVSSSSFTHMNRGAAASVGPAPAAPPVAGPSTPLGASITAGGARAPASRVPPWK
ncbi:uncharacterized protein BcabD6B2_54610 [Babesia caballi]|uniref:TFIIS N-terminal domain-containing protein n=1 Tax=Babesia caballi TaxID=5871 RepID=A0AAV4M1C9_BABCB|nr:hypothetical protein, conserved [Babesia caballi]